MFSNLRFQKHVNFTDAYPAGFSVIQNVPNAIQCVSQYLVVVVVGEIVFNRTHLVKSLLILINFFMAMAMENADL